MNRIIELILSFNLSGAWAEFVAERNAGKFAAWDGTEKMLMAGLAVRLMTSADFSPEYKRDVGKIFLDHYGIEIGVALEYGQQLLDACLWQEAFDFALKAIQTALHSEDVLYCYAGIAAKELARYEVAEDMYSISIGKKPAPHVINNLALLYMCQDRYGEAQIVYENGLKQFPGNVRLLYGLSQLNLLLDKPGAIAEYDVRMHMPNAQAVIFNYTSRLCQTLWKGESLKGKSLLVFGEQGIGDQIQFGRYLRDLRLRFDVGHLVLICPREAARMFSPFVDDIIERSDALRYSKLNQNEPLKTMSGVTLSSLNFDYMIPIMSLAQYCSADSAVYLRLSSALPSLGHALQASFMDDNRPMRIGLCWQGNPSHINDRNRSLPSLDTLQPVLDLEGVEFYSLQYEVDELPAKIVSALDGCRDYRDTLGIIKHLDLVITVDTSIVHAAASLGVKTLLLLPRHGYDWRWGVHPQFCDCYPSITKFRQSKHGDWSEPVAAVRDYVKNLQSTHLDLVLGAI